MYPTEDFIDSLLQGKSAQQIEYALQNDIPVVEIPVSYDYTYDEYIFYRKMGFRAVTAFGLCKYGFNFLCTLVID